jgi:heme O synthase-like polyprenyltransferase
MSARVDAVAGTTSTWRGLVELTKPRLSSLVLFTTLIGFALASQGVTTLPACCTWSSAPPW